MKNIFISNACLLSTYHYCISLEYLSYMENEEIAYRFFLDEGNELSQIAAYYNSCYMIPEKCHDIEKSWSFLRELLKADYQLQIMTLQYVMKKQPLFA